MSPEQLAQMFHETYERLAPQHGYETRKASAKPWAEVPEQNRAPMIATCGEVLATLRADLARANAERDRLEAALVARHGGEPVALLAELDVARAEAEQWRREHEVMCIEAKDARARSRQDADERDAARAEAEALAARCGVLREAALKARHPSYPDVRDLDAALSAPDEAVAARDERLKREEQRMFYGGLALAFGLEDEDLNSVGSSVVEKIRAQITRDALLDMDTNAGFRAGLKTAAALVDNWHIGRGGYTELAHAILALAASESRTTPGALSVKLEAPNEHALLDGLWRTFVVMLGKMMGDRACPGGRGHISEASSTDRAETCPYCVCEFMRGATDLAASAKGAT